MRQDRPRSERVERWGRVLLAALGIPLVGCESEVVRPCEGPDTSAVDQTGLVSCASGRWRHRAKAVTCADATPRAELVCEGGTPEGCTTDADCPGPHGYCVSSFELGFCQCVTGCVEDSECGADQICVCGDPVGSCVSASCKTDADCEDGALCASYVSTPAGCGGAGYACQSREDACMSDDDCNQTAGGAQCVRGDDGVRRCEKIECAIGRPFLVGSEVRLPPVAATAEWAEADLAPELSALDATTRARLVEHWTRMGRMEHASIAAFARFGLQLLALGAPAELLERTAAAMGDEARHAELAFGLASAYAGAPVGPGPLAVDGALGSAEPEDVLRLVIREGCIGETVASFEAREALARASGAVERGVLEQIARDESEHALLAWRTVRWMCETFGRRARDVVSSEIGRAETEARRLRTEAGPGPGDETLLGLGIATDALRAEIRAATLERVAVPGLRALAGYFLASEAPRPHVGH